MWWASLARTSAEEARSYDGLDHGDDVCGVGDAGVTAGCPHMRRLAMTLARKRHPSLRLGWDGIDTRRCAASSDTASSVALDALTVWSGVPTASSLREECKCLFAIWA